MKSHINLLPWRLRLHRRQSRSLLYKIAATLSVCTLLMVVLNGFSQQISARLTQTQTEIRQLETQLDHIEQQAAKLRQNYVQWENRPPLPLLRVENTLTALGALPLQQGELDRFSLNADYAEFQGVAENQEEFEQMNRFLTESTLFKRANLVQFIPQTHGGLQFQFMLYFEEGK